MKLKIPDTLFGINTKEAYDRIMAQKTPEKPAAPTPAQVTDPNLDLEKYILMDGQKHGSYSYSDLIVAKKKTLHNHNWHDSHKELHKQNAFMLTIRQYVDFINLLKSGNVYNGKGSKLPKTETDQLLDEILTQRDPWRAEWLDADFKVVNEKLHIHYNHRTINNQLTPQKTEELAECLMADKTPGIDLDQWLKTANQQGLPAKNTKDGSLYYWYPRDDNNSVARFRSNSDWVYLDCDWYPSFSNSALGVRSVRTR